jgi:hypothetical protein
MTSSDAISSVPKREDWMVMGMGRVLLAGGMREEGAEGFSRGGSP